MVLPNVIHRDKDILGGTPVFAGTRVPVKTMFDYLAADQPLSEFLDDFPTVRREQAVEILNVFKHIVIAQLYENTPRRESTAQTQA